MRSPFAEKHGSFASGCVLLPGGKTLVSAGYDGQLLWHDVATKKCFRRVKAHSFWSWQLALSPDGRRVATVTGPVPRRRREVRTGAGGPSRRSRCSTRESGDLVRAFDHGPPVLSVAFSPDSQPRRRGQHDGRDRHLGPGCRPARGPDHRRRTSPVGASSRARTTAAASTAWRSPRTATRSSAAAWGRWATRWPATAR